MNPAPNDHGQESAASAAHLPVMLGQILEAIQPEAGKTIIDGTFGGGGYARALLDAGAAVIAMDRDPTAIEAGRTLEAQSAGRLTLVSDRFSRLDRVPFDGEIHGVVLDVGVSSMQIDQPERGFSFRNDGPLDMRMSASGPTAADIVNAMEIDDLVLVLRTYGEERHAGRIARAIDRRRLQTPFETTADLAQLVESVIGRKPGDRIHPATRVFQGLRIFVNDELGELALALEAAERVLVTGGRLAVVTFHSLEDRLVKAFLRDRGIAAQASRHLPPKNVDAATFLPLTKSAVRPHENEIEQNPRSRSARLRAAVRTDQKPRSEGVDGEDVTARAVASRNKTHERLHRLHRHWKTAC